jgi:hypothetical protein
MIGHAAAFSRMVRRRAENLFTARPAPGGRAVGRQERKEKNKYFLATFAFLR